jgi:hypothetical protein
MFTTWRIAHRMLASRSVGLLAFGLVVFGVATMTPVLVTSLVVAALRELPGWWANLNPGRQVALAVGLPAAVSAWVVLRRRARTGRRERSAVRWDDFLANAGAFGFETIAYLERDQWKRGRAGAAVAIRWPDGSGEATWWESRWPPLDHYVVITSSKRYPGRYVDAVVLHVHPGDDPLWVPGRARRDWVAVQATRARSLRSAARRAERAGVHPGQGVAA